MLRELASTKSHEAFCSDAALSAGESASAGEFWSKNNTDTTSESEQIAARGVECLSFRSRDCRPLLARERDTLFRSFAQSRILRNDRRDVRAPIHG